MKFLKLALLVGGFVLLSGVAGAQESWRTGPSVTGAATPDPTCPRGIGVGATCYWTWNASTTDSPVIEVTAEYATLSFTPNVAAETAGATIQLRRVIGAACTGPSTITTVATSEAVGNGFAVTLTGDGELSPTTQDAFIYEVPTGCYYILPANSTAADAIVSLTGAPVGRQ